MTDKNFEQSLERLESIVKSLEEGNLPLDQSLQVFEEGIRLMQFCSKELEAAEKKVSMLVEEQNGKTHEVPFDLESREE